MIAEVYSIEDKSEIFLASIVKTDSGFIFVGQWKKKGLIIRTDKEFKTKQFQEFPNIRIFDLLMKIKNKNEYILSAHCYQGPKTNAIFLFKMD